MSSGLSCNAKWLIVRLMIGIVLAITAGANRSAVTAAGVSGTWKVVPAIPPMSGPNVLTGVAVVAPNDVWTVGYGITGHWDGVSWTAVAPASAGNPADLRSVAAVSTNDVWAVGRRQDTVSPYFNRTLIEHWNGSNWSIVPSPNGSTTGSELLSVAVTSANDIWAVGDYSAPAPMYQRTLIEHWDGNSWSVVPSPNVENSSQNVLTGVAVAGANDVWAVGYSLTSNYQTLIEHWDGSSWSIVPSPNDGIYGNGLFAVVALNANDVWAVGSANNTGTTLVMKWDGSEWRIVPSPSVMSWSNNLNSVSALAADDIWAVGTITSTYYTGDGDPHDSFLTLIEHWDGVAWSIVPSPNPGDGNNYYGTPGNRLNGVAAVSTSEAWAVGEFDQSDGLNVTPTTLSLRYTVP
jgi:hypothetical protein